jgi:hypothetical protein
MPTDDAVGRTCIRIVVLTSVIVSSGVLAYSPSGEDKPPPVGRSAQEMADDRLSVMDYCLPAQVAVDISDCAQAAIAAAATISVSYGGKRVFFPAQYSPYRLHGTLKLSSFVGLEGEGPQTSYIECVNGKLDCLSVGDPSGSPSRDQSVTNIGIWGVNKSAGAGIRIVNAYRAHIENVGLERMIRGVDVGAHTNATSLRDVTITVNLPTSDYGIYWHASAERKERSDVLSLNNVVVDGQGSLATGMMWDGLANTTVGSSIRFLRMAYGLRVINSAGSASAVPAFLNWHDFEAEGFSRRAVSIEAGYEFKFVNADLANISERNGAGDDYAVAILADLNASITRGVQFANARIGLSRKSGLYSEARDVQLTNVQFASTSMEGKGLNPVIQVGPSGQDSTFVNIVCEEFGGRALASQCLSVAPGAARIQALGFVTSYLNAPWLSDPSGVVQTPLMSGKSDQSIQKK